jgi:hypothetical protein
MGVTCDCPKSCMRRWIVAELIAGHVRDSETDLADADLQVAQYVADYSTLSVRY